MYVYIVGWLLLMVAFVVTQSRFYNAHRRAHGEWRPPMRAMAESLFFSSSERRAMLRATFHRDDDATVERARRNYLIAMSIALVYLLLAIPVALIVGAT